MRSLLEIPTEELHPLLPEVMSKQATINVGTIGHVAHGKSTIVKAICGHSTIKFKKEAERNITIKLGYANAKIYEAYFPEGYPPEDRKKVLYNMAVNSVKGSVDNDNPDDKDILIEYEKLVANEKKVYEDWKHERETVLRAGLANAEKEYEQYRIETITPEAEKIQKNLCCRPDEAWSQAEKLLSSLLVEKRPRRFRQALPAGVKLFCSRDSSHCDVFPREGGGEWRLQRHLSFVDCPGHDVLMATMLNGTAVMDAAVLLMAANADIPQPQTKEHLEAISIMGLQDIIVVLNKCEVLKESACHEAFKACSTFLRRRFPELPPIIPTSAVLSYNLDVLCEYLCSYVPVPPRQYNTFVRMVVIRSFDTNRPGTDIRNLQGGIIGGCIQQGVLRLGDLIEIRPGLLDEATGQYVPLTTRVRELKAENNNLEMAVPGGLIGVGTTLDPALTRADALVGNVLGTPGTLPSTFTELYVEITLLGRVAGMSSNEGEDNASVPLEDVKAISEGETLQLNVSSCTVIAAVSSVSTMARKPEEKTPTEDSKAQTEVNNENQEKQSTSQLKSESLKNGGDIRSVHSVLFKSKLALERSVCCEYGDKVAISRKFDSHWRLIGWGVVSRK